MFCNNVRGRGRGGGGGGGGGAVSETRCRGLRSLTHNAFLCMYMSVFFCVCRENLPGHFKFKEYCPKVFHDLRKRCGMDDVEYMVSVCMRSVTGRIQM